MLHDESHCGVDCGTESSGACKRCFRRALRPRRSETSKPLHHNEIGSHASRRVACATAGRWFIGPGE